MIHKPRFVSGIFGPYVQCSCSWRWAADDVRTLQIAFGHHRLAANGKVAA
jgi:hypothetical protein